jgi:hypothetical protein
MRNKTRIAIVIVLSLGQMSRTSAESSDLPELRALYEADQAARSEENMEKDIVPTLQEERDRRFSVFQMISEGKLQTANDYFRAGLILHHTGSIQNDNGHSESLGIESNILAFFLFRRAHVLGHKSGRAFMAAAYNYYLHACGEDVEKFGYRFDAGRAVWRPTASDAESETIRCGFDPRPYFTALDVGTGVGGELED